MSSDELSDLAHDVVSKSASLRSAAALLKQSSPGDRAELLALMLEQARALALRLERYQDKT